MKLFSSPDQRRHWPTFRDLEIDSAIHLQPLIVGPRVESIVR